MIKAWQARGMFAASLPPYALRAKSPRGKPLDPVARFHLGNGARLERLNFLGDTSAKGMREAAGLMVNRPSGSASIPTASPRWVCRSTTCAAPLRRPTRPCDNPERKRSSDPLHGVSA